MRDAMRLPPSASTAGGNDILDTLEREHREVEALFAQSALRHGAARLELIADIVRALATHAAVEEQVVYPAIADTLVGGDAMTARSLAEHAEIEQLLERLGAAEADDADLVADLRRLQLVVQAHVAVEEGALFPAFRTVSDADSLTRLTNAADKAQSGLPQQSSSAAKRRQSSTRRKGG